MALLAAIGAGWYTKLETGDDVKPSPATLLSITRVLRMSRSETEYTFSLAAVAMPISVVPPEDDRVPLMVEHLIERPPSVGAVLWDRYVTAVRWNAIVDAMFDFARFPDPMKRNAVVRLQRDQFRTEYYPEDHEDLLQNLVGMFRRAYLAEEPTPFARKVYELAEEFFHSNSTPRSRNHPAVGRFSILGANLRVVGRGDFFLRIIGPADAASAEKVKTLARLGTPSSSQTIVPEHIVGLG